MRSGASRGGGSLIEFEVLSPIRDYSGYDNTRAYGTYRIKVPYTVEDVTYDPYAAPDPYKPPMGPPIAETPGAGGGSPSPTIETHDDEGFFYLTTRTNMNNTNYVVKGVIPWNPTSYYGSSWEGIWVIVEGREANGMHQDIATLKIRRERDLGSSAPIEVIETVVLAEHPLP